MVLAFRLPRPVHVVMAVTLLSVLNASSFVAAKDPNQSFRGDVLPVLKRRCFACHGPKKQSGDLRIDTLDADLVDGSDAESWHDILNKLNLGEMPPEDEPSLNDAERRAMVDWLSTELRRAEEVKRASGGRAVLRRLTRYEYANTMRDLLGVDLDYASNLPPESSSKDGFQNNGATLGISPLQLELYLETARKGLRQAIVTGPKPEVFTHRAVKSEKVRRVKGDVSSRLQIGDRFLVRMNEFPREGQVRIRGRASAVTSDGAPNPRMRITMGLRADVKAPEKEVAVVDVKVREEAPQTYEFLARIEDFPLPGKNPKFPGLQITIYYGLEKDRPKKQKKKKPKKLKQKGSDGKLISESSRDQKSSGQADSEAPQTEESVIVIESVEFEGPVIADWPPESHKRILFRSDNPQSREEEQEYVAEVLRRFLSRAYRRPVSESDIDVMMVLYQRLRPKYESLPETMLEVLSFALVSPEFLYLVEPSRDEGPGKKTQTRQPLSAHELASRLSYFLWSSMPDERLFALAVSGKLKRDDVLAEEVERMLADPRSRQFVHHFTHQWFDLAALDRIAVNPEYHPGFDDNLKSDMRTETRLFFAEILDKNLSCLKLLDADFTILNRPLAEHYGLTGPRGSAFERFALQPGDHRGGLLAQGSFLLANSNGEDSHPIKRAVWLLDRLLDDPPAPPPPDAPELDPEQADLAGLPLKRQLEMHRQKPACNDCHRRIDPWGITLENYDAVGRWRTELKSTSARRKSKKKGTSKKRENIALDASATLPDGTQADGLDGLKQVLLGGHRRQFVRSLVKRLLTYGLGRTLDLGDRETIDTLSAQFEDDDYRLRKLLIAIVQSEPFRTK